MNKSDQQKIKHFFYLNSLNVAFQNHVIEIAQSCINILFQSENWLTQKV